MEAREERFLSPGEGVMKYEDDFKRWLDARGVSVYSFGKYRRTTLKRSGAIDSATLTAVFDTQAKGPSTTHVATQRDALTRTIAMVHVNTSPRDLLPNHFRLNNFKRRDFVHYIRLSEQIVVHETAINDVLEHVANINDISEEEVAELIGQVEEAILTINEVEMQRDKALADVLVHKWSGKEAELNERQPQVLAEVPTPEAGCHQKLALLYGELLRNDKEIRALQSKLKTWLDAVNGKLTTHNAQIDGVASLVRDPPTQLTREEQVKSQCEALTDEMRPYLRQSVMKI
ncbi:hypothetical protein F443_05744 [Phytophthora nicotianae P1569]|uniref:Uncharacterized protein n=2 Tax=Phytophthora nicotianae TaxID=4792 RepID=V9FH30_PHYNI|nr:hypothetical protein F443_05744 [Phytophthora nicotianae P1569]ETO79511.1 hypothetical protein F444_05794 [Phytophthora nicotianae P1976]